MHNEQQSQSRRERAVAPQAGFPPPVLYTAALFGKTRAVVIEHAGERYVLRITRNGKLILTK